VYQKELFRKPEMWSSDSFLVFKPDDKEAKGPCVGDSEEESNAIQEGD